MKVLQLHIFALILLSSCSFLKVNKTDQAFDYIFPGSQIINVNTIEQASRTNSELYDVLRSNNITKGRLLEVKDISFGQGGTYKVFVGEDKFVFLDQPLGGIRRWLDLENIRNLVILSRQNICDPFSGRCRIKILPGSSENRNCSETCTGFSFANQQLDLFTEAQEAISKLPAD